MNRLGPYRPIEKGTHPRLQFRPDERVTTMLERIFWFYNQLKRNAFPSMAQYRARFEVSQSTFKRDLAFLRDRLGAPIHYDRHHNGYHLSDASFELPSFWFNPQHLLMILGLCRRFAGATQSPPPEIRQFRQRVETLLSMQYGKGVVDRVSFENVEWARCDNRLLDTVLGAILEQRLLCMTYHTAYSGETACREVEPYRLHSYRGTWHLAGFCHYREQPRIFMLSRIRKIEPLDRHFDQPRFDVAAFLDESFGIYRGGTARRAVLRFTPTSARIVRDQIWHQNQKTRDLPGGGLELTLPVADLTEIRRHVLKYGAEVEVLEPDELRRQVAEEAARIVKIYQM